MTTFQNQTHLTTDDNSASDTRMDRNSKGGANRAKRAAARSSALQSRARSLAASSALNTGSRLATAALWAAMVATTTTPALIATGLTFNHANAEDLVGTAAITGSTGSAGGVGNGGGGTGWTNESFQTKWPGGLSVDGGGGGGGGDGATGTETAGANGGSSADSGGVAGSGIGAGGGGGRGANGASGGNGGDSGGGDGENGVVADGDWEGGGGGGGVGALEIISVTITGGQGGGNGGGGGAGLYLRQGFTAITLNNSTVTGGNGGNGSSGGGGGAGALVNGKLTNISGAVIQGGSGGAAPGGGYAGGSGGDGVAVVGEGSYFENQKGGTVTGGAGGRNFSNGVHNDLYSANGGAGIRLGHDAHVVNAGTVTAGTSYNSAASTHTGAIEIVGARAVLELQSNSVINGTVHVADNVTDATLVLGGTEDLTVDIGQGVFSRFATLKKSGAGTATLLGSTPAKTPWTVEGGLLSIGEAGGLGASGQTMTLAGGGMQFTGDMVAAHDFALTSGKAVFETKDAHAVTLSGNLTGTGGVTKKGDGTLILTGANDYTGGTAIEAGTLQIGNWRVGEDDGSISGDIAVASGATLVFDYLTGETYAGKLSGAGDLVVNDGHALALKLTGDSSGFTGTATVNGQLEVNGTLGATTTTVQNGGVLSGTADTATGNILGNVTITSSGRLLGSDTSTLTVGGALDLQAGSTLTAKLGVANANLTANKASAFNSQTLALGNHFTIDIENQGGFGKGYYYLFTTNSSLAPDLTNLVSFINLPNGVTAADLSLRYDSATHRVYLESAAGVVATYWNGQGARGSHTLVGGTGVWNAGNSNWTDSDGEFNSSFEDGEYAVFGGTGGVVTVDNGLGGANPVTAAGLQFETGGYTVTGDPVRLHHGSDAPIINVGGTAANASEITTVFETKINSDTGMTKTGEGTLIFATDQDYTGLTTIREGTLQLGQGGTTGAVSGDKIVIGLDADDDARLAVDRTDELKLTQSLTGTGQLVQKNAAGTTVLLGDGNTYTGGTIIEHGTVQVGDGGAHGSISSTGNIELQHEDSHYVMNVDKNVELDGIISGKGTLTQAGRGTTTLTRRNTYEGETKITDGVLKLEEDGSIAQSSVVNIVKGELDVSGAGGQHVAVKSLRSESGGTINIGNKTLNLMDANADNVFAGEIKDGGAGGKVVVAGGQQRLTGENSYTGGTAIDKDATLLIGDGGEKGSVKGKILVNGTLIHDRSNEYAINELSGGGDLGLRGGGTGVITTEQHLKGKIEIAEGNTLKLSGEGDISEAAGVNNSGNFNVTEGGFEDIRIGYLNGAETGQTELGDKNLIITNGNGRDARGSLTGKEYAGVIERTGGLTIEKGTQVLSGENSYTGETHIMATGELHLGNASGRSGSISSNVLNEGVLSGTGSMQDLDNRGIVSPGMENTFSSLTVGGNYTSTGGKLILHEKLADDTTKGDRLVIAGNTSGTTEVTVVNRGGLGGQTVDGVKVISVGGQSDGEFVLNGTYENYRHAPVVIGGAYAYTLEKGGVTDPDGNWYLRSRMIGYTPTPEPEPEYQAGVPLYGGAASAIAALNRGGFASFGSRMKSGGSGLGSGSGSDLFRSTYFWGQMTGGYSFYTPNGNATGSTYGSHDWKLHTGLDGQLMDNQSSRLFGTVWLSYDRSSINVWSRVGNGKIKVDGYGLGGALTWYGTNGLYVDAQGKATWYKSDMTSDLVNEVVASGVKSFGYALSLEGGHAFALNDRWTLTPQAQLIWSSLRTNDYSDAFQAFVNTPDNQSLTGRLGLAADYATSWRDGDGTTTRLTIGGLANIYQELKSGSNYITVSDVRVATGTIDKTWGEIGMSANYSWSNDAYAVFGKATTASSLQNFGDSYSVTGNLGFRVKW